MDDEEIISKAIEFAKANKKVIAKRLTDKTVFMSETHPVSVFMAGSPGAGKTESAKELIEKVSNASSILRIDSDELRCEFEDYTGVNSSLFQAATSIVVEKMHDIALTQKQSFVFDGTLSNLAKTIENIKRSHHKDREVFIVYVYQDPRQAWDFVKQRAKKDGRCVPLDSFIDQYFSARSNVNTIKQKFENLVQVDIVIKNIDGTNFKYKENINLIDNHIKELYSVDILNDVLK